MPTNAIEAEQAFEALWSNPTYTRVELTPLDVNGVLDEQYVLTPSGRLRGSELWELEIRKARDPFKYIPSVVRRASTFGHRTLPDGTEIFVRVSEQRRWLAPEDYETVIERTYIHPRTRIVTFIGVAQAQRDDGELVRATGGQVLFSVQHGAAGTEEQPLNTWRIVHHTERRDERLVARFEQLASGGTSDAVRSVGRARLPEYIPIFLEQDLDIGVRHRT